MKLYRAYNFKNKDPAIDELRTLIEDAHGERVKGSHLREIEENGGPSTSAMRNWFFGATRRPSNCTLEAAGRTLGFKRKWTKSS